MFYQKRNEGCLVVAGVFYKGVVCVEIGAAPETD